MKYDENAGADRQHESEWRSCQYEKTIIGVPHDSLCVDQPNE